MKYSTSILLLTALAFNASAQSVGNTSTTPSTTNTCTPTGPITSTTFGCPPGQTPTITTPTGTACPKATCVDQQGLPPVEVYGQCGGSSYHGSTVCVSGAVCTYVNQYYSQCLAVTIITTAPTTTPTAITSPCPIVSTTCGCPSSLTLTITGSPCPHCACVGPTPTMTSS